MEHQPDPQEELPQHGPQLRDQVKLHDLTQERVVAGGVRLELMGEDSHAKRKLINVAMSAFCQYSTEQHS